MIVLYVVKNYFVLETEWLLNDLYNVDDILVEQPYLLGLDFERNGQFIRAFGKRAPN